MPNVEAQLAELSAAIRHGLDNVTRRMDDHQSLARVQHQENVTRLERIETEVRTTNGRVTRHDEQLRTLFRRHDAKPHGETMDAETLPLNIKSARLWIGVAVACIGGTYFVMTTVLGFAR